jgi:hypothetical protein
MRKGLLVWLVAVMAGCAAPQPEPYTRSYDAWLGPVVNVADGIDKDEASVIAYAFFASGVADCGSPLEPKLVEDIWVSNALTDSAKPGRPIYVEAKTGSVQCGDVALSLDELKKIKPSK